MQVGILSTKLYVYYWSAVTRTACNPKCPKFDVFFSTGNLKFRYFCVLIFLRRDFKKERIWKAMQSIRQWLFLHKGLTYTMLASSKWKFQSCSNILLEWYSYFSNMSTSSYMMYTTYIHHHKYTILASTGRTWLTCYAYYIISILLLSMHTTRTLLGVVVWSKSS